MTIKQIEALEVFDSNGNPTIEINLIISNDYNEYKDYVVKTIVPSRLFAESSPYTEHRDKNKKRLGRKGVAGAVASLNTFVTKALAAKTFHSIREVDSYLIELDGTKDRSNLGCNSILGLSLSFLKAFAITHKKKVFEYLSEYAGTPVSFPKVTIGINESLEIRSIHPSTFSEALDTIMEVIYECEKLGPSFSEKTIQEGISKLGYSNRLELGEFGNVPVLSDYGTVSALIDHVKEKDTFVLSTSRESTEESVVAHLVYGLGIDTFRLRNIKGSCVFSTANECLRIEKFIRESVDIIV